jgi:dipeptidyl aminopeptidase/acylaminoacyl peptidase
MKIGSRQGEGASQLLTSDDAVMILNDWSVDGSEILFSKPGSDADLDLWRIRLDDGSKMPLLATEHSESQARLSPDGQWVAYTSDESGAQQVYVDRYPGLGARQQVSLSGGGQPQWQADQQALYFLSSDRAIMSVDVSNSGNLDSTLVVSEPRRLFRPAVAGDPDGARDYFAVVNNGERFLVDNAEGMDRNQGITVIVNWAETLQDNAAGLDTTF